MSFWPDMGNGETLEELAARARACTLCTEQLPHGPRPVYRYRL